jgi:hypothetical protein
MLLLCDGSDYFKTGTQHKTGYNYPELHEAFVPHQLENIDEPEGQDRRPWHTITGSESNGNREGPYHARKGSTLGLLEIQEVEVSVRTPGGTLGGVEVLYSVSSVVPSIVLRSVETS